MIRFLLPVVCLFSIYARAETVEKTVAIVNSEAVLLSDFDVLQKSLKKPGMVDETLIASGSIADLEKNRKEQLQYLINEKLLLSEIKRQNLTVTNERIDQELREMAKKNNMSSADLTRALQAEGLNIAEYRQFLKDKIEKQSLIDLEVLSKIRISDEEALHEYSKTHPSSKPNVNEFTIAHIFFSPKKGGVEAALARARNVLSKLVSGDSFETLAEQNSEDPNFASGGLLGSFKAGEFLPEVEDSIKSLQAGQTTEIIKSRIGFHIVKLLSLKVTTDSGFEKEKEKIRAKLFDSAFRRQLKIWLQTKRENAFIKIND